MRKALGLLLICLMCCGIAACGDHSPNKKTTVNTSSSTLATQTENQITAPDSTESHTTTTTTTTTEALVTTATGETKAPTSATQSSDGPQTVASPFTDVSITEIALYDTQLSQMEEAVLVKTLTDAAVAQRLAAATWEYYPTQDKWVKYNPLFAEWALVLTCTDGKQRVLHLLDANVGWASLGTFDGGLDYAAVIQQAKSHSKDGSADFDRYKIDGETLAYLLVLFDT